MDDCIGSLDLIVDSMDSSANLLSGHSCCKVAVVASSSEEIK